MLSSQISNMPIVNTKVFREPIIIESEMKCLPEYLIQSEYGYTSVPQYKMQSEFEWRPL